MKQSIGWIALVLGATLATSVAAIDISSTGQGAQVGMTEGRISFAPFGFKEFCRNERAYCDLYRNAGATKEVPMVMSPERLAELKEINSSVNHSIRQVPEFSFFGLSYKDEWKLPSTSGDCEDLALLKQKLLIEKGWPESALLVTVADMSGGTRHAVLTVSTQEGDLILDNVTDEIKDWREVDYRWIKRQSARNMMRWVEIVT